MTKENASEVISLIVENKIFETNVVLSKRFFSSFLGLRAEDKAEFVIYRKKDNKTMATLTTNEEGYAEVLLPYGEYILKQVSGKTGYYLQEDVVFSVNEKKNREKKEIQLVNFPYQGKLEFLKLDAATRKGLKDAFIEIYSEEDVLVFQGKTDEFGKLIVNNLDYGKYYLKEKQAPKGYALSVGKNYFEINEAGQVVSLELENEQEVVVPSTNKISFPVYLFLSILCFSLGTISILYAKKKI